MITRNIFHDWATSVEALAGTATSTAPKGLIVTLEAY